MNTNKGHSTLRERRNDETLLASLSSTGSAEFNASASTKYGCGSIFFSTFANTFFNNLLFSSWRMAKPWQLFIKASSLATNLANFSDASFTISAEASPWKKPTPTYDDDDDNNQSTNGEDDDETERQNETLSSIIFKFFRHSCAEFVVFEVSDRNISIKESLVFSAAAKPPWYSESFAITCCVQVLYRQSAYWIARFVAISVDFAISSLKRHQNKTATSAPKTKPAD